MSSKNLDPWKNGCQFSETARRPEHAQTLAYSDEDDDEADGSCGAKNSPARGAEKTQAYGDEDDGEETQDDDEEEKGCEDNGQPGGAGDTDLVAKPPRCINGDQV